MPLPRWSVLLCLLPLACKPAGVLDSDTAADSAAPEDSCDSEEELLWYIDEDGDGYGSEEVWAACPPEDAVTVDGDCDDSNEFTWPGAEDICDGQDNDCNDVIDDGEAGTLAVWYFDTDGDGYGHVSASINSCGEPEGYSEDNTDCDDSNGGVYPGAPEICDGYANDCDGTGWVTDDGTATFYSSDTETYTGISSQLSTDPESAAALTLAEDGVLTLCDADWHVDLTIAADVTVVGLSGPDAVGLIGSGSGPAITVQAGHSASIENLSISGGVAEQGGGIYIEPITCSTDKKKDGEKKEGEQPYTSLRAVRITGNVATAQGGGVYTDTCSYLYIDESTIEGNTAETGGGIYAGTADEDDVTLYLNDSLVLGNTATAEGGGVYSGAGWTYLRESTVEGNTAETGGGVSLTGSLYISADEEDYVGVIGNTASEGGGVYMHTDSWLYAADADWGGVLNEQTQKTSADNTPEDIAGESLTGGPFSFGLGETFTCTDKKGCVVEADKKKE